MKLKKKDKKRIQSKKKKGEIFKRTKKNQLLN